jgi:hypothetical protein
VYSSSEHALHTASLYSRQIKLLLGDFAGSEIIPEISERRQCMVQTTQGATGFEEAPNPLQVANSFPLGLKQMTAFSNPSPEKGAARERVERRAGQVVQGRNIRTPIAKSLTRAIDEYCIPKDNIDIWSPGKVIARTR